MTVAARHGGENKNVHFSKILNEVFGGNRRNFLPRASHQFGVVHSLTLDLGSRWPWYFWLMSSGATAA